MSGAVYSGPALFRRLALRADTLATRAAVECARVVIAARPVSAQVARSEALYLASVTFGRPQRSLARAAGISQPRVHSLLRQVEDGRESASYDRELDELQLQLMGGA